MELVDFLLLTFWVLSWILISVVYVHSLTLSFYGIRPWKAVPPHSPTKRFAILVAAHNEESVIKPVLEDLSNQDYPKGLFDTYLIADNCTDRTAEVARSVPGVITVVRVGEIEGKGGAIRTGLEHILSHVDSHQTKPYDAYVFFDADNRVSLNFLQRMNDELCEGNRFIQGYLGTKNPYDNWVTRVIYLSYAMTNRLWQMAKRRAGLPSQCGGTGFCVAADVIQDLGWPMTSLTEDLEMVCLFAQKGIFPVWSPEAIVYDEKPTSLRVAFRQRTRWMRGHFVNLFRFFIPLVKRGIVQRDVRLLDCALYLLSPLAVLAIGLQSVLWLVQRALYSDLVVIHPTWLVIALIFGMLTYYPSLGIYLETRSAKELTYLPLLFAFNWTWVMACFVALATLWKQTWYHTPHRARLDDGIRL